MDPHGAPRDSSPGRVRLTPRDALLLADLVRFGALTTEQIRRRHFPGTAPGASTVGNRLRALRRAGYLRSVPLGPHLHGAHVATPRGATAAGCGLEAVRQREPGPSVWLRHALAVADVAEGLLTAGTYHGGAAAWRTERELARDVTGAPSGDVGAYRPDGLLVLTAPDGTQRRMAVEVELGAKQPRRYGPKLAWYGAQLATGALHRVRWYCAGPATARAVHRACRGRAGVEVVPLPAR